MVERQLPEAQSVQQRAEDVACLAAIRHERNCKMNVTPFHCGPFANESERTAFEHLRSRIESSLGASDDQWMLLTNLTWSVTHQFQADEIDMIAIGPPGVRVIEVKHWSRRWVDEHPDLVDQEADRVTNKARKIGTTSRKSVPDIGRVDGVILLTRESPGVRELAGRVVRGVLHRLQLHAWAPRVLDSWQPAPGYAGEIGTPPRGWPSSGLRWPRWASCTERPWTTRRSCTATSRRGRFSSGTTTRRSSRASSCPGSRPNAAWGRLGRRPESGRRRRRRKCVRKDCTRRTPARTATRCAAACASCSRTGTTKRAARPLKCWLRAWRTIRHSAGSRPSSTRACRRYWVSPRPCRRLRRLGSGRKTRSWPSVAATTGWSNASARRGGYDVQGGAARPHEEGGSRDLRRQGVS